LVPSNIPSTGGVQNPPTLLRAVYVREVLVNGTGEEGSLLAVRYLPQMHEESRGGDSNDIGNNIPGTDRLIKSTRELKACESVQQSTLQTPSSEIFENIRSKHAKLRKLLAVPVPSREWGEVRSTLIDTLSRTELWLGA
jgi:hypothetical protein